jgi:hypothetical protein
MGLVLGPSPDADPWPTLAVEVAPNMNTKTLILFALALPALVGGGPFGGALGSG